MSSSKGHLMLFSTVIRTWCYWIADSRQEETFCYRKDLGENIRFRVRNLPLSFLFHTSFSFFPFFLFDSSFTFPRLPSRINHLPLSSYLILRNCKRNFAKHCEGLWKGHYVNVRIIMLGFGHYAVCKGVRFRIILSPFDLQFKEVQLPKYQENRT